MCDSAQQSFEITYKASLLLRPRWGSTVLWWPCLCECVCLSAIISSELHVRSSPNLLCVLPVAVARSSSDGVIVLRISGFMDDVIFAHKRRLLDVAARQWQWSSHSHASLGLARRNTVAGNGRSGLLFAVRAYYAAEGVLNIWDHVSHNEHNVCSE